MAVLGKIFATSVAIAVALTISAVPSASAQARGAAPAHALSGARAETTAVRVTS